MKMNIITFVTEASGGTRSWAHRPVLKSGVVTVGFLVLVGMSVPVAIGIGSVPVPPAHVIGAIIEQLGGPVCDGCTAAETNIVWLLRLPRVIIGCAVGAGLSVAGAAVQALTRNVLADPYLLGVSQGASLGAATHILFGVSLLGGAASGALGAAGLAGSAFAGAVLAIVLVLAVARIGGRLVSSRLVFAGIAIGFALGAVTNLLVFLSESRDAVRAVMFWTLGSLGQTRWDQIPIVVAVVAGATALLWLWSRRFDALSLGDDTALSLGTDPTRFRAMAVIVVAACVAVCVSVSGAIGFVGLVVPHIARLLVGAPHRRLLPVAALLGSLVLVWSDVLARTAFQPTELPLGVLTALLGTPLLVILVHRLRTT